MHAEPLGKCLRPSGSDGHESSEERASFANKGITILPNELLVKIFSNLAPGDLTHCQLVNRRWQELVDDHMLALAYYRHCHRAKQRINPLTVERYHSSIRGWLAGFSNLGRELAARLDMSLQHKHFSEILFFFIAKVLAEAKALTCQNVGTITHSNWVSDISFSPDGDYLVTVSLFHSPRISKLVAGQWQEETTIQHSRCVKDVCFSPDGERLVTASSDRTAKLWRLVNGQWQVEKTIKHPKTVITVRFSPDGKCLVIAARNGGAKFWRLVNDQWQEETTIEHSRSVNDACFSPDGRYLVTASNATKIWELVGDQWQAKATIQHSSPLVEVCFSPDGNHIVGRANRNNTAAIWGLIAGQWRAKTAIGYDEYERTNPRYPGWLNDICFSPDGNYLAIAAADNPTIWKLVDGEWKQSAAIKHSSWVSKVSFSPDGNHLLTVSDEPTVKIWGLANGRWLEKATIENTGLRRDTSFSPDGHYLVTVSDDVAKIWVLKSKENADSF